MNFFNDDEKLKKEFGIKYGEVPKTKFIDNIDAVKVKLLNWPDEDRMKEHLIQFATGSWFKEFAREATEEDYRSALEELSNGKILAQGLEGITFSFLVSGLSLHGSHALVRTRIGAAYLQQSQAVMDLRHCDILVPRAFQKFTNLLERYKRNVIEQKMNYIDLLETNDIAITDARFCLPKTIPVWVNVSMSLPTILGVYSKRTDFTEEHPEMNKFAEELREQITLRFPWMDSYFKRDTNCIHRHEGYRSNCVFKRDGPDVLPEGSKQNWHLHDKTKNELMINGLEVFQAEFYIGQNKTTKEEYDRH
jgi:thymidylate synthase ThyX